MWCIKLLMLVLITKNDAGIIGKGIVGNPLLAVRPCPNNDKIFIQYEPNRAPDEENQYYVYISENFMPHFRVEIKFDSDATVTLTNYSVARITATKDYFYVSFFKQSDSFGFKVEGPVNGSVPYIKSFMINSEEYCDEYKTGYLDDYIMGYKGTAQISLTVPDDKCGRRKVQHTALITNGLQTKAGDWPWHAAIYRLNGADITYICGGTLLSKNFVLTAAHCTSINGSPVLPESLSVVLGKYNLIGGDVASQEREVFQVIVHEEFKPSILNNDIALLKLKSEAVFDDYVQPACQWYPDVTKKLPQGQIFGTVVGWGFDHTDTLSSQLRQATIPKVSETKCIKSNPVFFGKLLSDKKFCAGLLNGTSACNGDSGGGFTVFVPDALSSDSGAWYIRGIVSLSAARRGAALCDPTQYVIFTDVAKYRAWLQKHVK